MLILATTTLTVYRGQTEDEWGDPVDVDTTHLTNVRANLSVSKVKATTESSNFARVDVTAVCRVRSNLDINDNDIIKDNKTGLRWQVESTSRLQNPGMAPDLRLNLLRVE